MCAHLSMLDLFPLSPSALDNFVSTNQSVPGYTQVRVSCYVRRQPDKDLVPLQLFYSAAHKDHLATASAEGVAYAKANGYSALGVQGYVRVPRPPLPPAIAQFEGTALDVAHATFLRREGLTESILATATIYAHATRPSLLVQTLQLYNLANEPVEVCSGI